MKKIIILFLKAFRLLYTPIYMFAMKNILFAFSEKLREKIDERLSKPIIDQYLKNNSITKLQIGCGGTPIEGWINTDLYYNKDNNVLQLDVTKPFPLHDNSINYILSEQLIEHFEFEDVIKQLEECYRVLKPNGVLRIATPDLDLFFQLYANPKNEKFSKFIEWNKQTIISNIAQTKYYNKNTIHHYIINQYHSGWGHKILFNFDSLEDLLLKIGFKSVVKCDIGRSAHRELVDIEMHGKAIQQEKMYQIEALAVEATK